MRLDDERDLLVEALLRGVDARVEDEVELREAKRVRGALSRAGKVQRTSHSATIANSRPMIPIWIQVQMLHMFLAVESALSVPNSMVHESTPLECWTAEMMIMASERRMLAVTSRPLMRRLRGGVSA